MDQLTCVFKILSDETRLRIILLLYQQELCVCELSGLLGVPQPKVSKNLAKLRDMNLVVDERKEKFVFYSLKNDDQVLLRTLQNIIDSLELYPQLINDRNRLRNIEQYRGQC